MAYTRLGKFASLFCCRRVFALASRLVRRRRMARVCIHSAHTHEVREGERVICQQKVEKDTEDEGEEGRRREASKTRTKKKRKRKKGTTQTLARCPLSSPASCGGQGACTWSPGSVFAQQRAFARAELSLPGQWTCAQICYKSQKQQKQQKQQQ